MAGSKNNSIRFIFFDVHDPPKQTATIHQWLASILMFEIIYNTSHTTCLCYRTHNFIIVTSPRPIVPDILVLNDIYWFTHRIWAQMHFIWKLLSQAPMELLLGLTWHFLTSRVRYIACYLVVIEPLVLITWHVIDAKGVWTSLNYFGEIWNGPTQMGWKRMSRMWQYFCILCIITLGQ
jgi:hypothetical protein